MDKSKKNAIVFSIIAIVTLITLVVGATYAYFQAQGETGTSANLRVTTYTTDVFNFEVGNDISIYADATSFASGKGNASGSTFAKAILTANNKTNTSTMNYYLYLNISNNTFTYTQNENTPELLLTIKDAGGNSVTDITSLAYKTVTDGKGASISGYDITNKSGLITLFNNKEITASPTKTDEWNITVTLVNYDKDQSNNAGKSFNAKLMIQKEKIETVATVCSNGQTLSSCIIAMNGKDDTLYHHTSSLANGAGDNSYRYAGASDQVNNFVCFGSNTTPCPTDNLYRIIGVFDNKAGENQTEQRVKLIKSDYATSTLLGGDGDYSKMYSATNWNKSSYKGNNLANIATYNWNKTGQNTWSLSNLNKTNLNQNFITNIGKEWAAKIDETTWKVGGNTWSNLNQPAKTAYQNEIVQPQPETYSSETEDNKKIGLMYASDYGFAAASSAWTTKLFSYNGEAIINVNWMYMGLVEWTISRNATRSNYVLYVSNSGNVYYRNVDSSALAVRPVFYLTSSVNYASGSGSAIDPIVVN